MAELPAHPDNGPGPNADAVATGGRPRWKTVAWVSAAIALVVAFVVLHLTGVIGPESH